MKFICFFVFIFTWFCGYTQVELWGVTSGGGINNSGTIFKTDGSGNNQTIEHSFIKTEPEYSWYTNLLELTNGKLYGLTGSGGTHDRGTLFEYDPITNVRVTLVNFSGTPDGSYPRGSLVLANDGNLYGMTYYGGINDKGTIFQFNPQTNTCIKKFDFDVTVSGSRALSSFIQATDGNLYATTNEGGINNFGVLFKYDIQNNQYTKLMDFDGTNTGQNPIASLTQHSVNGLIYGTTGSGGINSAGVIFEYNITTNQFTKKIDFNVANGSHSFGSLLEAPDGMFYGLNNYGGANNMGVIYQYNPVTNSYTIKIDFAGSTNGSSPRGNLVLATNGNLYGMTASGGTSNDGTLFQYNYSTNALVKKIDFTTLTGSSPFGSLVQSSNGKMYGVTFYGGTFGVGAIIEFNIATGVCIKKQNFGGLTNGTAPSTTLLHASDGNFYGIANAGGTNIGGVLYKYDPILHTYSNMHNFIISSGDGPRGSLMQASDGNLYGTTTYGGVNDHGTLFQYNIATGTYTKKFDFNGLNGSRPYDCKLLQATNGKLYGMTHEGSIQNAGVIFQYDISTNSYTKLYEFDLPTGGLPQGSLIEASDGNLYGMTEIGGIGGASGGILFQFNPTTNVYSVKFNFLYGSGMYPKGGLVEASDRKLYGMTYNGGLHNCGTIIQFDPLTNILIKKFDFSGVASGKWPNSSLMQASDGNLYGLTTNGGANDLGVMFQFDPVSNSFIKKIDFDGVNGSQPYFTNLIEVKNLITSIRENDNHTDCLIYPNPNNGSFTVKLQDAGHLKIFNALGEIVMDKMIEVGVNSITIPDVKSGFYFLKIENTKGETSTNKIIISN
ncbi:MAG: T9SS type A sorting domain-containing protein [Burkholderiales bacterium]|nr:T9SS type A sorting domain-containing protein [Bacteroidia bacterium]